MTSPNGPAYGAASHPLAAGLGGVTPTQRLMLGQAGGLRGDDQAQLVTGRPDEEEGALAGLGDTDEVLGAAGYTPPKTGEELKAENEQRNARYQPVQSDADPPRQGIISRAGQMFHVRNNGDGTASATHMGSAGAPDIGDPTGPAY
jgi:hypothetical protein